MPVNYAIAADVFDLRTTPPNQQDAFFVDTNVWFWTTYPNTGPLPPRTYQLQEYPRFIRNAKAANSSLFWSGLQLAELAHVIEKTERDIYNAQQNPGWHSKVFRHNFPNERLNVVRQIRAAWQSVGQLGRSVPGTFAADASCASQAISDLAALPLDGYDLFIIQILRGANIFQVVSDDGDFSVVNGISLFTANQSVISAARSQGMLKVR
jgi:hypothetical protein